MQNSLTPKEALLSALYVLVLFIFLAFFNYCLFWIFNNVAFNILDWFHHRTFWVKLLLLVIGGGSVCMLVMGLTALIPFLVGNIMGRVFPINAFTVIVATLLSLGNAIWSIFQLWEAAPSYDFWIFIELLLFPA